LGEPKAGKSRRLSKSAPPPPDTSWAYFFDIDGTLVEIAQSPEGIVVHDEIPDLIGMLHRKTGGAVALITGRAIADVERLLPPLRGIVIAGQHGLEVRSPSGAVATHPVRAEALDRVREQLASAVMRYPELIVEYKGLSIALHYRNAPRLASYSHRLMRDLRRVHVPDFVIQRGKRVVELKAAGKDKGIAIAELMAGSHFRGRIPVFAGDDATDELGFRTVNRMGGHSIKIGNGRTHAQWRLPNVGSLRAWLHSGTPE
jgi:trehalose 6-phosphate phosphatase